MEEVYRFPLLRLKPPDAPLPFVIPAKAGIQRRANGKTAEKASGNAINRIVLDLDSRFLGNDGKRVCVETRIQKNSFETGLSDFVAVYPNTFAKGSAGWICFDGTGANSVKSGTFHPILLVAQERDSGRSGAGWGAQDRLRTALAQKSLQNRRGSSRKSGNDATGGEPGKKKIRGFFLVTTLKEGAP